MRWLADQTTDQETALVPEPQPGPASPPPPRRPTAVGAAGDFGGEGPERPSVPHGDEAPRPDRPLERAGASLAVLSAMLDAPISVLGLPSRIVRALRADGIAAMGQLAAMSDRRLRAVEGVHLRDIRVIRASLAAAGFAND